LIYGIWVFPEMGIAAIGTIVSRIVMLFYALHPDQKPKFHPYFENFSLKKLRKNAK
jgi:MATE family multidrug resistance protein